MEITYTDTTGNGHFERGMMPYDHIPQAIATRATLAKKEMQLRNPDHVLYGMKCFDSLGALEEVRFYMMSLTDDQFAKLVKPLKNTMVYAVHKQ